MSQCRAWGQKVLVTCDRGKEEEGKEVRKRGRKGRREEEEAVEREELEGWKGKKRKRPSAWRAGSADRSQSSHAALLWQYFCLTFLKTKLALPVGRVSGQQGSGVAQGFRAVTSSPSST